MHRDSQKMSFESQLETSIGKIDVIYRDGINLPLSPETIDNLVSESDLVVLDDVKDYVKKPEETIDDLRNGNKHRVVTKAAMAHEKPMLLADMEFRGLDTAKPVNWTISALEILAAVGIHRAVENLGRLRESRVDAEVPGHSEGRRTFLKALSAFGIAWSAAPSAANLLTEYSDTTDTLRGPSQAFDKISKTMHPEFLDTVSDIRNLAIAYKLVSEMEMLSDDSRKSQTITMFLDKDKAGVEDILRRYESGDLSFSEIKKAFDAIKDHFPGYIEYVGRAECLRGGIRVSHGLT